jgi:hypothetical protein
VRAALVRDLVKFGVRDEYGKVRYSYTPCRISYLTFCPANTHTHKTQKCARTHARSYAFACEHTKAHSHIHTHTHTCKHMTTTYTCARTHKNAQTHTHTHTRYTPTNDTHTCSYPASGSKHFPFQCADAGWSEMHPAQTWDLCALFGCTHCLEDTKASC